MVKWRDFIIFYKSVPVKFTDYYLLIPIRVYHTESEDYEESGDFGVGWARIHYSDIQTATWFEGYPEGMMGLSTKVEGFPLTIIKTMSLTYMCNLPMREFEEKLNSFMDTIDEAMGRKNEDNLEG